jgi:hypothetical protein
MFIAIRLNVLLSFCVFFMSLVSGLAHAQPTENSSASRETSHEKNKKGDGPFSRGIASLVFDEEGKVTVMGRDGKPLPACQICTPELQKQWGPRCEKATSAPSSQSMNPTKQHASTAFNALPTPAAAPLICNKLQGTDVLGVTPVTVLEHTGSKCMTFLVNSAGKLFTYQVCW